MSYILRTHLQQQWPVGGVQGGSGALRLDGEVALSLSLLNVRGLGGHDAG